MTRFVSVFPPHARGWTQLTLAKLTRRCVSPARVSLNITLYRGADDLKDPQVTPTLQKTVKRVVPHDAAALTAGADPAT